MSHIFISYSRDDLDFAQNIVNALAENNLDTWIDWKNIHLGEDWEQKIYRGIEEADAFLFLISARSVVSEMCNKEIAHAMTNGKRILPIFISQVENHEVYPVIDESPFEAQRQEIRRLNFIFCREGRDDFERAIAKIHEAIRTDYEWLQFHTRLGVKALEWERSQDASRLLRGKELRDAEERQIRAGQSEPQLTDLQRHYLLTSRRNEERQRRMITLGLGIGLVVVAILAVLAWGQRNLAVSESNAKGTALVNEEIARNAAIAEANARGTAQAVAERQAGIALARQITIQADYLLSRYPNLLEDSVLLLAEALGRLEALGEESPEVSQALQENIALLPRHLIDIKHTEAINTVVYSPDGKWIATSMIDVMHAGFPVNVWRASDGVNLYAIETGARVTDLEFSPDSRSLAFAGSDGLLQIWDLSTGKQIVAVSHDPYINDLAFSPDGNLLASAGRDGTARLWDLREMRKRPLYLRQGTEVLALSISPDGRTLATAGDDESIRIWDLQQGTQIGNIKFSPGSQAFTHFFASHPGSWLAFSPDSSLLAVGDDEGQVQVWDIATRSLRWSVRHENAVTSLVFSQDHLGREYVASASVDGTVRVWQLDTGREYLRMAHSDDVNTVAYNPAGNFLASASADGTARVWETFQGKEISRMTHPDGIDWVVLSPDGIHATTITGRTATIWEISTLQLEPGDSQALIEGACSRLSGNLSQGKWNEYVGPDIPYHAACPTLPVP